MRGFMSHAQKVSQSIPLKRAKSLFISVSPPSLISVETCVCYDLCSVEENVLALDQTLRLGAGFSLADLRAEQPPQMLEKGQSRYEVPLSELPPELADLVPDRAFRSGVMNERTAL
eukprot:5935641-Amphidinium_carterae.3